MFWFFFIACVADKTEAELSVNTPLNIKTGSYPVHYLVSRIYPQGNLECIIPEGEDPPDWNPSPELIASLSTSDLLVANGAGFEKWMETAALSQSKTLYSAEGLDFIYIEGETHSHGKKGEHSHAGIDPHTWSDPIYYQKQAKRIAEKIKELSPDDASRVDSTLATLNEELQRLDVKAKKELSRLQNISFAANHPAYNYLAKRYDLKVRSFDFDPQEPLKSEKDRTALESWHKGGENIYLLWESLPDASVQQSMPQGVKHIYIDPLEQPESGQPYDYIQQFQKNLDRFSAIP
ncbi:MAG: metal ABC transporter substrate-binding protein [Myxococcota bacterium]|nr:metal ABC transporter substrate-binding protein [Myxococcota bacterium]